MFLVEMMLRVMQSLLWTTVQITFWIFWQLVRLIAPHAWQATKQGTKRVMDTAREVKRRNAANPPPWQQDYEARQHARNTVRRPKPNPKPPERPQEPVTTPEPPKRPETHHSAPVEPEKPIAADAVPDEQPTTPSEPEPAFDIPPPDGRVYVTFGIECFLAPDRVQPPQSE